MSDSEPYEIWWRNLTAMSIVGTSRRQVPSAPSWPIGSRNQANPETIFLDQVAVGAALRRAGAIPATGAELPAAAPDDELPVAPERARQLLDLLLTQSPVGSSLSPLLIRAWLDEAARAGYRVPHRSLPRLLEHATATPSLRESTVRVIDQRGRWVASQNPVWSWAISEQTEEVGDIGWTLLSTEERASQVRALRRTDPGRGRDFVESTWATDPATARATLISALRTGLSLDDEAFLERALDDRGGAVREVAYTLLDALPDSARAHRLGSLLAPLISTKGLIKKKTVVELPTDPGPEAVRDGLGKAPKGRSERGMWLERLAAGAPLQTWQTATGLDPRGVIEGLDDADALRGLRTAIIARRDPIWAQALADRLWDPQLLEILPADVRVQRVLSRMRVAKNPAELLAAARLAPPPWPDSLADELLGRLAKMEHASGMFAQYLPVLAEALTPRAIPSVLALAKAAEGRAADPFNHLAQYLSLLPTIRESFT